MGKTKTYDSKGSDNMKWEKTSFESAEDKLRFLKNMGLTPKKFKEPKPLFYDGIQAYMPTPCDITGYYNNRVVSIIVDGTEINIAVDYLKEMQPTAEEAKKILSSNISNNEGEHKKTSNRPYKGRSLIKKLDTYVVLDLETTGLDPSWDNIIELAAIKFTNGYEEARFQSLVNPGGEIDSFITDLTGITNEMLMTAPSIQEILPEFIDFIGDRTVLGHNVNFDINFIYDNSMNVLGKPFRNDFVDTMRLSRRIFREHAHHRLSDLVTRFQIGDTVEHRAMSDAMQTHQCYEYMKRYAIEKNISFSSLVPNKFHSKRDHCLSRDVSTTNTEFDENSPIFGKLFVFTGSLERMTRKGAMQLVVDQGGCVGDTVTGKTNYLVLGNLDYCAALIKDGKSGKQKKAEQLKLSGMEIEIISESVFYDMIEK